MALYLQELERQNQQQVGSTKDTLIDALPQTSRESSAMPLNPIDDQCNNRGFNALRLLIKAEGKTHSPSSEDDEQNREYLIRRAAL